MQSDVTSLHFRQLVILLAVGCLAAGALAQPVLNHPDVSPSESVFIAKDQLKLAAVQPREWAAGTPLPSLLTGDPRNLIGRITEEGALDSASLVLTFEGRKLVRGKDYLVDEGWGTLGIPQGSSINPNDNVDASYRYFLLRIDSIVQTADGKEMVRQGVSSITTPKPPALAPGDVRVANIFIPYRSDGTAAHVEFFPVLEDSNSALTHSTMNRIPLTLAKLKAGKQVKIVCWGDSITAGGDATTPQDRYTAGFEQALKAKFDSADIAVKVVAAGGSTTREWLFPDRFPYPWGATKLDFNQVLAEKPDLVTIEFVNDAYIDEPQTWPALYNDIVSRITNAGAEVIIISPSFFNLSYMKFHSYQDQDSRAYDFFVRRFAAKHNLGIADVSSRWEHLYKEGIPYTTYLVNSINHPDDRGHLFFVEELMKNFE